MGLARRKSARTDLVEFIEERGEDGVEPLGPVVVVLVDAPAGGTVEPAEKRRLGLEFQGWARAHPPSPCGKCMQFCLGILANVCLVARPTNVQSPETLLSPALGATHRA